MHPAPFAGGGPNRGTAKPFLAPTTVYARCVAEGRPQAEFVAADEGVSKDWDVLHRILEGAPPGSARTIAGGKVLPEGGGGKQIWHAATE